MSFFEQLKQDIGITDMQLVGGYYIVDFAAKLSISTVLSV